MSQPTTPPSPLIEEINEGYTALSSFVPEVVKRALNRQDKIIPPYCETFYSAALFADVSGFTIMSQVLASKGTRGTEELPQHINSYLGQIVRKVIGYGGDVVKFAGDALLCVWLPDPALFENMEKQKQELTQLTLLAVKCALDIQNEYGVMKLAGARRKNAQDDPILRIKLGIGAGKSSLLIVGGILNRCEYLVCGDALLQAFQCEEDCKPQEVVISKQAQEIVGNLCEFKPIPDSKWGNGLVTWAKQVRRERFEKLNVTQPLAKKMKDYIPLAVRPHLDMPSMFWTGELREVTVLFINLPFDPKELVDLDKIEKKDILHKLQKNLRILQSVVYRYQGSLNKFLVDDKGCTVMAVFGLPPVAHNNDSVRAILAALELQKKFARVTEHHKAALGLASGIVFSGLIGGTGGSRREYTVLGNQVNLAARLMGLAKKEKDLGQVICDRSVHDKGQKEVRIAWLELGAHKVKGLEQPVEVFHPILVNYEIVPFKVGNAKNLKISDIESLTKVSACFDATINAQEGKVIFVEGEIAVGKSTFLGQLKAINHHKAWFLWGRADCFHSLSKMNYMVWQQVMLEFSQKYSLSLRRNRHKLQMWIKQRRPDLEMYLFALTDILQMGAELEVPFKKNPKLIKSISEETLVQYRHDLLICLLEWVARKKTLAIVIDEIQFLEIRDWQLTRRLALVIQKKLIKNIVLLVGGMPMDNRRFVPHFTPSKRIVEYIDLRNNAALMLSPHLWTWQQTKEWIITELEVRDCSKYLVDAIYYECGGRPGFCAEFLRALREAEESWIQVLVHKSDPSDRIATFTEAIEDKLKGGIDIIYPIPPYLQSITAAHLDCISTELLMCLKTAAVICKAKDNRSRQFEEEMLRGTHPVKKMAEKRQLRKSLIELKNMGFIVFIDSTKLGLAHALQSTDGTTETEKKELPSDDGSTLSVTNISVDSNNENSIHWGLSSSSFALTKKNQEEIDAKGINSVYTTQKSIPSIVASVSKDINNSGANEELSREEMENMSIHPSLILKRPTSKGYTNGVGGDGTKKSRHPYHRRDSSLEEDYDNDPMPSAISLFQEPATGIPYKKGRMYKRGVSSFNFAEQERFFVFKHHTLYWFKDKEKEHYPINRIKFGPGLNIKLDREDDFHLKVFTAQKHYMLRAEKKKDMDEWQDLFKKAIKEDKETTEITNEEKENRESITNENNGGDNDEHYSNCHIYEFSYGFLRDVIYEQTLYAHRQQLHMQANSYIEQLLLKSYDQSLALLQERHQELANDKDEMRKKEEQFHNSRAAKKRHSKMPYDIFKQAS